MKTTDGGANWWAAYSRKIPSGEWVSTGLDVTNVYGIHFDPFDSDRQFLTYTDIGLFRSEDGGATWQPINNGLTKKEIWWVEQHSKTGELWAGVSPSAMFKSADRGDSWTECEHCRACPPSKNGPSRIRRTSAM
jgi:photosystem II stability/assembly factor-like uncharacterized protein